LAKKKLYSREYRPNHLHLPYCQQELYFAKLIFNPDTTSKPPSTIGTRNIVLVGNMGDVDGLACILDCRVSSLPMKYLGLPLGTSYKAISI